MWLISQPIYTETHTLHSFQDVTEGVLFVCRYLTQIRFMNVVPGMVNVS